MGEDGAEPQSVPGAVGCGRWYGIFSGSCTVGGVMEKWLYESLNEKPGIFGNWRKAVRVLGGWAFVGLLLWAAIYELVKW